MALKEAWRPIGRAGRDQWQACATELDLRFQRGTARDAPLISGDIDGYHIDVTSTDDRKGQPKPFTLYEVRYGSLGIPIRIARETAMSRIGVLRRLVDVRDLEIGDSDFDKLALIDAEDPESAAMFLSARRRQVITELLGMDNLSEVVISESTTSFRTRKLETSAHRLCGNILGLVGFARIMGAASTSDGTSESTQPQRIAPTENVLPPVTLSSYFDPSPSAGSAIQDSTR